MERLTPAGVPIYDSDAFGWSMRGGMLQSPTHIAQRGYSHGFRDGAGSTRVPSGGGSSDTSWQQALGGLPMPSKPSVSAANSALKTIWTKLGGTIATCLVVSAVCGADVASTAVLGTLNEDSNVVVGVNQEEIDRRISDATNGIPESAKSYADAASNNVLTAANAYTDAASNNVLTAANAYTDAASNNVLTAANAYTDAHSGTDPEAVRAIVAGEIATATGGLRRVTDNESRVTEAGRWIPGAVYWGGADGHPLEDQPTFGDWTWTWAVAGTGGSARFEAEGDADATALTFRGRGTLPPTATFSAELASPSSVSGETFVTSSYVTNRAASALVKATAHADAAAADALVSARQYADGVGAGVATAGTNYTDVATGTLSRAFGPRIGSEMRDLLSKTNATDIASEFETNSVVGRLANDRIGFDVRGDTLSFVDGDSVLWSCRNGGGGGVDPEDVREIVEPMIGQATNGLRNVTDLSVYTNGHTRWVWSTDGDPTPEERAWLSTANSPDAPQPTWNGHGYECGVFADGTCVTWFPYDATAESTDLESCEIRTNVVTGAYMNMNARRRPVPVPDPSRALVTCGEWGDYWVGGQFYVSGEYPGSFVPASGTAIYDSIDLSSPFGFSGFSLGIHGHETADEGWSSIRVEPWSPATTETLPEYVTRRTELTLQRIRTALDSLDASTATVSQLINALKGALEEQQ